VENWTEYVGFQPSGSPKAETEFAGTMIFYLQVSFEPLGVGEINISIARSIILATMYDIPGNEIGDRVEETLSEFPTRYAGNIYQLNSLKTKVAMETRRGAATTNFGDVWYYSGNNEFDQPVIVSEHKGKYAIWKHPNFDKYGFRVTDIIGDKE
jgi:hypothetical protein